ADEDLVDGSRAGELRRREHRRHVALDTGPQELPRVGVGRREIDVAPPYPARARPAGADQLHRLRIVHEDEVVTELERAEVLLGRFAEDFHVLTRRAERL